MTKVLLPFIGFLGAILVLIPVPRQIRVRNISTLALSFWLFGTCLCYAIGTIIWAGNANDSAPVWCDISSQFRNASLVGFPAAIFCICKRLELVSSARPMSSDKNHLRHLNIFVSVMCFVIPCLWLIVFYCFKAVRYVIIEDFGCYPGFFPSNVAVGVIYSLPLLLSAGSLVYGSIALYHFINNYRINSKLIGLHLRGRDTGLSTPQYYRLVAMSMILSTWSIVFFCLQIAFDLTDHPLPLDSWQKIHSTDSVVIKVTRIQWSLQYARAQRILWWSIPGFSYVFVLLFATSREVLSEYPKFWVWFRTYVLRWPLPDTPAASSSVHITSIQNFTLPIRIDQTVVVKNHSVFSS